MNKYISIFLQVIFISISQADRSSDTLYYVFDSDGDTVFFDKRSDSEERPSFKDYKIIDRVTPKQGRVVLFDGRQYHANYLPRKSDVRSVINMNLGADYKNVLQ